MIRVSVTNESGSPRRWFVEPYGDEVILESDDDVLSIEYDHPADLTVDITLHDDGELIWTFGSGKSQALLPRALELNGRNVWTPKDGTASGER